VQFVATKANRLKVIKWMIVEAGGDHGETNLCARTVDHFPDVFRAESRNANLIKARRWYDARTDFIAAMDQDTNRNSIQSLQAGGRHRVELKALPGRGRKRDSWVYWIHEELLQEFHRLRKIGMKLSPSLLVTVAKHILQHSEHPQFSANYVPIGRQVPAKDLITCRWIQTFQERFYIVKRKQSGKKSLSPQKQIFIEKEVAFHMGVLQRGFESGEFDNVEMCNMDETHFVIDMDNGKTLGLRGDVDVRYADVVGGTVGMTMVVMLTGGLSSNLGTPMMIFVNDDCNYPMRGLPDTVPGTVY
jgi:hypothetical protein